MADFEDGKEAGALRTIGEVSKALGIKTHVLRYWEQQFPMLKPLKRSGGRRYYRSEDVELVRRIDTLVNHEGYTLKGAKAALKGTGGARLMGDEDTPSGARADHGRAPISPQDLRQRLKAIRDELEVALAG